MRRRKIAVIFGTRPEAIKMAPVIKELRQFPERLEVVVISSGQHREMLAQALKVFGIKPDYDLKIMLPNQRLTQISKRILAKIESIFETEKPDLVLVHGDTPTAFVAALSSFYSQIPIGHVEAGLRTYNKYQPFPEEINRQLIDILCDWYFAPTAMARENLLREGKPEGRIWVTGNTAIDAVVWASRQNRPFGLKALSKIDFEKKKVILLTCHRRESWGEKMRAIFEGIRQVVEEFKELEVVFPVHLNPRVKKLSQEILGNQPRIHLFDPFDFLDMVGVMKQCWLVATDSGGLQEEAPYFNKPVLVLREVTERPEGLKAGTLKLVGTSRFDLYQLVRELVVSPKIYQQMARAKNPFGDGQASQRIRKAIFQILANEKSKLFSV